MNKDNIQRIIIEQVCENGRGRHADIVWKVILVPYDQTKYYKLLRSLENEGAVIPSNVYKEFPSHDYTKPKNEHYTFNKYGKVLSFLEGLR